MDYQPSVKSIIFFGFDSKTKSVKDEGGGR